MRYIPFSKEVNIKNRKRLYEKLLPDSFVILAGNEEIPWSGDQYYPFRQNSNFFYLCGIDQEDSFLCLYPNHPNPEQREVLFIKESNSEMLIWNGKKLSREEAAELSGIQTVRWNTNFQSHIQEIANQSKNIYLSMNETNKGFSSFLDRDKRLVIELKDRFPLHNFERLSPLLVSLRLIKCKEEVEMIRKSVAITKKAFNRVLKTVKPGMKEFEVEAEITFEFVRNGVSSHAYAPIIAGGSNACVLHYTQNDKELKRDDLLLLDFGASYANYASDCSRTIPVNGKFSSRQKDCYNAVLSVFRRAVPLFIPGMSIEKINKEVDKMMEEVMIDLGLFTKADRDAQDSKNPLYRNYYMHGVSHFMGLDVHDVGLKNTILQKGMVLTCEPGIYIKEEGIGVRIENDILVDDISIDLMSNFPIEIEEIEKMMD